MSTLIYMMEGVVPIQTHHHFAPITTSNPISKLTYPSSITPSHCTQQPNPHSILNVRGASKPLRNFLLSTMVNIFFPDCSDYLKQKILKPLLHPNE